MMQATGASRARTKTVDLEVTKRVFHRFAVAAEPLGLF